MILKKATMNCLFITPIRKSEITPIRRIEKQSLFFGFGKIKGPGSGPSINEFQIK
jgi:hypothetical protein